MSRNRKRRATKAYKQWLKYYYMGLAKSIREIDIHDIFGKKVFVFESHEYALICWQLIQRLTFSHPFVITLDDHTDTIDAFHRYLFNECGGENDAYLRGRKSLIDSIRNRGIAGTQSVIAHLANDEHIHAAVLSNIISACYCIQLSNGECSEGIKPIFEVVVEIPLGCFTGCQKSTHDDACMRKLYDDVLEDVYLRERLILANKAAKKFKLRYRNDSAYILDIDLDYFHSRKSLNPEEKNIFYELIRKSVAITIAKESEFVEDGLVDDEEIDVQEMLLILMGHIREAQSNQQ